MKPHLTSPSTTLSRHSGNQDRTTHALAHPLTIGDRAGLGQEVRTRPQLTLASAPVWKHKLILKGRLDHRTKVELQDEIECLCEEGVTLLTLDLGQLDEIDSDGAKAIACGGVVCRERGRDFTVVPGSPAVHRALAEVGAEGLLAGRAGASGAADTPAALALSPSVLKSSPDGPSTVMVKKL